MAAPKPKLTEAEIGALIDAAVALFGFDELVFALAGAIGPERARKLAATRKAIPWTKADTMACVDALWPLVKGATVKAKRKAITAAVRPCFATQARYDMVMEYVVERILEFLDGSVASTAPVPGKVPDWRSCTHSSNWREAGAKKRMMNILSPLMPDARVAEYLDWQAARGANTVNLIIANHRDGEFGGWSIYGPTWGWQIHRPTVDLMLRRILECRRRGFAVVIWFITDDSAPYASELKKDPARYCRDVRDLGLLAHVSFVCPALEKQDHFGSRKDAAALIAAVRSVWPGVVATHETSGKIDFADLGDLCLFQLDPGKTPAQVKTAIAAAIRKTGKPVGAFELDRIENKALCDAAFAAGAVMVGNCDGGPGPFIAGEPAQPSGGWPAELANVKWLHTNVRGWKVTTSIAPTISGGMIRMPFDKSNVWPTKEIDGGAVNANPWAIVNIGGQWAAGTWEWLRKGDPNKSVGCLDGSKGDHFKVSPLNKWRPAKNEQFYLMVSGLARSAVRSVQERSEPVKVTWK